MTLDTQELLLACYFISSRWMGEAKTPQTIDLMNEEFQLITGTQEHKLEVDGAGVVFVVKNTAT